MSNLFHFKNSVMNKSLLALFVAAGMSLTAAGQVQDGSDSQDTAGVDWEENLQNPPVPAKANAPLARHMETLAKWFSTHNLDTKTVRKNEVVVLTVPCSQLFNPNETTLLPQADALLGNLKKAVDNPESYRILVAAYADDSGDDKYSEQLTENRAQAVAEKLEAISSLPHSRLNIYYYAFGNEKNIVPNNTIENRARNRRIEIYLVPETKTVDAARSGKL